MSHPKVTTYSRTRHGHNTLTANAQARVVQPIPATIPAKHMLLSLPSLYGHFFHANRKPDRLAGLFNLDNIIITNIWIYKNQFYNC